MKKTLNLNASDFDHVLYHKCNQILKIVSEYFAIDIDVIKSYTRERDIVKARHIAFYMMIDFTAATYGFAGAIINRDHAAVVHAINSVSNQVQTDKHYRRNVIEISDQVREFVSKKDDVLSDYLDEEIIYFENMRI